MVFGSIVRAWRRRKVRRAIGRLKRMSARDVMSTYLITTRPDEPIVAAATKMVAEAISCLLVMEGEKLVGIITERDFLHKVPFTKDVFRMRVHEVMTAGVITVKPSTPLTEAVRVMKERNFRRLVVEDGGKVIGIITQNDLLRLARRELRAYPDDAAFALDAIMSRNVLTASVKDSFTKARDMMRKRNVGCILITDRTKPPQEVLGIFTEYDVVSQFYEQQGKLEIKELDAFMRKYVRALPLGTSSFIAIAFILDKRIRRIPVAQETRIAGMATETDLVRFLYLNLDKVLAAAERKDAVIRRLPRNVEFRGEFRGDHLKVYSWS